MGNRANDVNIYTTMDGVTAHVGIFMRCIHLRQVRMNRRPTIVCRKCRYYYITWDARQPHGCKAMGFKSRRPPSQIVRQSSGQDCMRYRPKTESDQH